MEKELEDKLKMTKEIEETLESLTDEARLQEIESGAKHLYMKEHGNIIFRYPSVKLSREAELIYAKFYADHLRKDDLMTEEKLKAYYSQPIIIEKDGKEVVVKSGTWTDEDEAVMEQIPEEIKIILRELEQLRDQIQEREKEASKKKSGAASKLKIRIESDYGKIEEVYRKLMEKRIQLVKLQTKRLKLFALSLEEQANYERIKFLAPYCVFKEENGEATPIWSTSDDLDSSGIKASELLTIFSLFMRGGDVSFFGDVPETPKT